MSVSRPRIRLYLDICDVGGRGGEVQVTWTTEDDQRAYMAHDLDNAADRLKPILRRLMYGADQPAPSPAIVGHRQSEDALTVDGETLTTDLKPR